MMQIFLPTLPHPLCMDLVKCYRDKVRRCNNLWSLLLQWKGPGALQASELVKGRDLLFVLATKPPQALQELQFTVEHSHGSVSLTIKLKLKQMKWTFMCNGIIRGSQILGLKMLVNTVVVYIAVDRPPCCELLRSHCLSC